MSSFRHSMCTFVLAFSVFVISAGSTVAKKDVDVNECKLQCRRQRQFAGAEGLENDNPYVFHDEDFTTLFKTQEGRVKVLRNFRERSQLFKGIENIRMLNFELNPQTFFIPSHWDSDILFFVAQGKGTITLVFEEGVKSFNIEKGHLMTVPAGMTFYMINRDDYQKLLLFGFVRPIANPGRFAVITLPLHFFAVSVNHELIT
ncbi:vicilin Cor a 11.0101-like [Silene latifolia]|uniref:vicilin Cor a 11.0101-like n=1 Tax=Silene latifolia TaxID=37657 RepID=UPI003D77FDD3